MIELKHTIPHQSILKSEERCYNYVDSFHGWFVDKESNTDLKEFVTIFIFGGPKWVDYLMALRDKMVGIFGLKTAKQLTEEEKHPDIMHLKPGEQLGIFEFLDKGEHEIIVGGDDKHLNLKISLILEPFSDVNAKREFIITTCVKFNNLMGRLYFLPVKPFHRIIVYTTMKDIIKQLEKKALKN